VHTFIVFDGGVEALTRGRPTRNKPTVATCSRAVVFNDLLVDLFIRILTATNATEAWRAVDENPVFSKLV
jgi:hypothetical protein